MVIRRILQTVLLVLDGLLLVLFAVGYVARYLHPRFMWWAELVATGLPYLSLALLVATVGVAVARRWVLLALHGAALVCMLVRFVPAERGAAPGPDDLRVMTYNTSRGGGARADALGSAITALVRAESPDLVAFQEAYVEYHSSGQAVRPEGLLAALVDSLGYRTIGPLPAAPRATYTPQPVLGRVELLDQTQTILPRAAPGEPTSRVVRTHFRWQGREAVHYNLHLRSFGSRKPWEDDERDSFSPSFWATYLRQYRHAFAMRAREAALIHAMIARETLPIIVSGDFNSTPHNGAYYELAQGLRDAFKIAGHGWGATYHGRLPLVRIDHVLVSKEWEVVSAYVADAPYSDHRPVVVRLRWKDEAEG